MKINIDYYECLKSCLDYAEKQVQLSSELLEKKVSKEECLFFYRKDKLETLLSEKYDLSADKINLFMSLLGQYIAQGPHNVLDCFSCSTELLSRIIDKYDDM